MRYFRWVLLKLCNSPPDTGIMAIFSMGIRLPWLSQARNPCTESVEKKELVFRSLSVCFWAYWALALGSYSGQSLHHDMVYGEMGLGMDGGGAWLKLAIDGLMGAVISYRQASGLNTRYRYVASGEHRKRCLFVHLGFGAGVDFGCCGEVVVPR